MAAKWRSFLRNRLESSQVAGYFGWENLLLPLQVAGIQLHFRDGHVGRLRPPGLDGLGQQLRVELVHALLIHDPRGVVHEDVLAGAREGLRVAAVVVLGRTHPGIESCDSGQLLAPLHRHHACGLRQARVSPIGQAVTALVVQLQDSVLQARHADHLDLASFARAVRALCGQLKGGI